MLRQLFLLLVAVAAIPVLLLGKPYMIRSRNQRAKHSNRDDSFSSESQLIDERMAPSSVEKGTNGVEGHHGGHEEHNFSDVVIHQVGCAAKRTGVRLGLVRFFPWQWLLV